MISNIVFTKNRPLQLGGYLESLYKHFFQRELFQTVKALVNFMCCFVPSEKTKKWLSNEVSGNYHKYYEAMYSNR
jgi:hypothetical protein